MNWKKLLFVQIFPDIEKILRPLFYVTLIFYFCEIIWPYLSLPYANKWEINTLLETIHYNPLNNILRYGSTLLIIFLGYTLVSLLPKKFVFPSMRVFFIGLLLIGYFLTVFIYKNGIIQLDMFHDGEQLGNAAFMLQGRTLYTGVIPFHGAFTDPLISITAFRIFGQSVGSHLLFTAILRMISFSLFFIMLARIIKSDLVFYLASIWFYNLLSTSADFQVINFVVSTIRDIPVWISIILIWYSIKNGLISKKVLFTIGLLAGLEFTVSLERAYFMTIFLILFGLYRLISLPEFFKNNIVQYSHTLSHIKKNSIYTRTIGLGLLMGFLLPLPFIGIIAFREFITLAFVEFPQMVIFYGERIFPEFSESPNTWIPLIIIIICGIFIIKEFFLPFFEKNKLLKRNFFFPLFSNQIFIIFVFIFSVIFFRVSLMRLDWYHVFYGSVLTFLTAFLIIDYILERVLRQYVQLSWYGILKKSMGIVFFFLFLFNYNTPSLIISGFNPDNYQRIYQFRRFSCYIDSQKDRETGYLTFVDQYFLNHLRCPPYKPVVDIKWFFKLPKRNDADFLPINSRHIVEYINSKIKSNDYVFVFSNEPAYYYFIKAKSPTRFSEVSFAGNKKYRVELLNDLKKNPPKIILYTTGGFAEVLEGFSMQTRLPEINRWILDNYKHKVIIDNAVIYER